MLRFLRLLWTGSAHEHAWEIHSEGPIIHHSNRVVGRWYDLRCKDCGWILRRKCELN